MENSRIEIDYDNINFDDQKTFELIGSGNTLGIFQLESNTGRKWSKDCKPINLDEISQLIALIRPGVLQAKMEDGKSLAEHYVLRKHGKEPVDYIHDSLKPILKNTYGILLFQEQAIKIGQDIAGMSLSDSDTYIRYCISGDSIMMTSNGPRYIKNLVDLKPFSTLTPTGFKKVKKVWHNGKQVVYKITLASGDYIKLTENHEVDTNQGWLKVKTLNDSLFLKTAKDYLYTGQSSRMSKDMMVLSAAFISEGCYCETNEPKITNKDKNFINKIISILRKNFGDKSYKLYQNKNEVFDIYLLNDAKKWIVNKFTKNKSRHKVIDNMFSCTGGTLTRAFCSKYFEGDGHVNKKSNSIAFSSTSLDIVTKIKYMLLRDGIYSYIYEKRGKYNNLPYISYSLNIGNRSSIAIFASKYLEYVGDRKKQEILSLLNSKFKCENERFLVPENIYLSSVKNKNLNSILGKTSGLDYCGNKTYTNAQKINNLLGDNELQAELDAHYRYSKIIKIEKVGEEDVYDFSMEDENEPFAYINNILVHNCIGKKKVDMIEKGKSMFISGCVKNGISEDVAGQIFSWIQAGQRYSFNACLTAASIVQLQRGLISLDELKIGDFILAPNLETNIDEYVEVTNIFKNGVKEIVKLTLEDGIEIECTVDHKFLCGDGLIRPLYEIINDGHKIICQDDV